MNSLLLSFFALSRQVQPIIAIGLIFGCSNPKKVEDSSYIENHEPTGKVDSSSLVIPDSTLIEETIKAEIESSIYIGFVEKFYNHNDNFISLYYSSNYSESVSDDLKNGRLEVIFEDDEMIRTRLDDSVAQFYFQTYNLEKLLLFDENQMVIDTLNRKNYEFLDNMISSEYIATYDSGRGFKKSVAVSFEGLKKEYFRKSPEFLTDSSYIGNLIQKNGFREEHLHYSEYSVHSSDTIVILSYYDYQEQNDFIYLLKNGTPTDSIHDDFVISKMTPVPLSSQTHIVYVSSQNVPDSDIYWNTLIAIDLEKGKFRTYKGNRLKIKKGKIVYNDYLK